MQDIKCPHCGEAFKIDETGYADIVKQIRDSEFEKQLHERLALAEREKQSAVQLAKATVVNELQQSAAEKDAEIQQLKSKLSESEIAKKLAVTEALSAKDSELNELKSKLSELDLTNRLAVTEAISEAEAA